MQESKRTKLKAELMKAAEARIEELLRWDAAHEAPTLSEIEGVVLEIRQRLSEEMMSALIQKQANVRPVPGPACEKCGEEMRYKDSHAKQVTSWAGELEIERGYYYCDHCHRGLFPPRRATSAVR